MTPSPSPHRPTPAAARPLAALLALGLLAVGLLAAACSTPSPEVEGEVADGEVAPAPASPAEPPAAAPSSDVPTACTQIGCNDGLSVELDGFDEEVELELTAGEETRTVTCLPPGPCHHFIPDFTPPEVTATAFLADGTEEERAFTPEYRDEQPNGPDCPPVCRQAAIRWKL